MKRQVTALIVVVTVLTILYTTMFAQHEPTQPNATRDTLFIKGIYHGLIAPATAISGLFTASIVTAEKNEKKSPYTYGYMIGIYLLPFLIAGLDQLCVWRNERGNISFSTIDKIYKKLRLVVWVYLAVMILLTVLFATSKISPQDINAPIINFRILTGSADQLIACIVLFISGLVYPILLLGHLILGPLDNFYGLGAPLQQLYGWQAIVLLIGIWIWPVVRMDEDEFGMPSSGDSGC